jgi:hypothetical protein
LIAVGVKHDSEFRLSIIFGDQVPEIPLDVVGGKLSTYYFDKSDNCEETVE